MRYLFSCLPEVEARILTSKGCSLMLDFDGTLTPLADTPHKAFLSADMKAILRNIGTVIPTTIISGRGLLDIQNKVGVKGLNYAGNHGLEWKIENEKGRVDISRDVAGALSLAKSQLVLIAADYPGSILEDKGLTIALHYRLVEARLARRLIREGKKTIAPYVEQGLLALRVNNKTFELRPALNWHKGKIAKLLLRNCSDRCLPIYIGDDLTDEDAFKALRTGITVRIGRSCRSAARYYLKHERQVGSFLKWLYIHRPDSRGNRNLQR